MDRAIVIALLLVATHVGLTAQTTPLFEAVSIKPTDPSRFPANLDLEDPCDDATVRPNGRRLTADSTTLYALIALAYNPWKHATGACSLARMADLIIGGPDWMKSSRYVLQAVLPEGMTATAFDGLGIGEATDVQRMLQAMLADRFRLTIRRSSKDLPVYSLQLDESANGVRARFASSMAGSQVAPARFGAGIFSSYPSDPDGHPYTSITFRQQPLLRVVQRLASPAQRPVVDQTGLNGEFDFVLEFDETGVLRPVLVTAIREQLGLALKPAFGTMEALIVERAERPTAD